jgi:hypothetical protein
MGVLMDAIFQWIILGTSHPAAALIVGPVLILGPYSVARALANRGARLISNRSGKPDSAFSRSSKAMTTQERAGPRWR